VVADHQRAFAEGLGIILDGHDDLAGADGLVTRDVSSQQVVAAIHAAVAGQRVTVTGGQPAELGRDASVQQRQMATLSGREREVLGLLATGRSTRRIARDWRVAESTVRTHVQNLLGKLDVHCKLEAAAFAWNMGSCRMAPASGIAHSGRVTLGPPSGPLPSAASTEEASRFAETLAGSCAGALGQAVAGVILHGSLTLDDDVPGRSDVDLLVVVDDPLTDAQVAALTEAVERQRPQAPGRVDLRVVTRQVAASPTPALPMELSIEITPGSGLLVERRHPGERDLAVELSMCRAHGRSLLGAAPAELIGEVPERWVLAVGDAQLADWETIGDDPVHAELTVLTTCRIWRLADEGRHCSKTAAGEWALGRDPTLQVVRDALRQRHRDPAVRIDAAQVAQLLALVRARLAERRERA
jgi:DNA-binding CsgD family transcriptional regulator